MAVSDTVCVSRELLDGDIKGKEISQIEIRKIRVLLLKWVRRQEKYGSKSGSNDPSSGGSLAHTLVTSLQYPCKDAVQSKRTKSASLSTRSVPLPWGNAAFSGKINEKMDMSATPQLERHIPPKSVRHPPSLSPAARRAVAIIFRA